MEHTTRNAKMNKPRLTALIAVAVLVQTIAGCVSESEPKAMTPSEFKADLAKSLAPGASVTDVEAVLTRRGLENSGLIDNAELAHMGFDPNTFELKTIIRGTRKSSLVTTDLAATFIFDRDKKLIETRVEEVHTGL